MKQNYYYLVGIAVAVLLLLSLWLVIRSKRHKKTRPQQLQSRWHDLQALCSDKSKWSKAIITADNLLDDVLKRQKYKGKTTGERLVRAQHNLTNNESVWFGHKLRNRLVANEVKNVSKQDTLEALSGFRQALKDLGALRDSSEKKEQSDD